MGFGNQDRLPGVDRRTARNAERLRDADGIISNDGGLQIEADGSISILLADSSLTTTTSGLQLTTPGNGIELNSGALTLTLDGGTLTLGGGGLSVTNPLVAAEGVHTITSVQTSGYTATIGECVRCDPSGAGFTVTLPTAVGQAGRSIIIKNTTSSTNTITIDGDAAETIDGNATETITTGFGSLTVVSDGANWMIV